MAGKSILQFCRRRSSSLPPPVSKWQSKEKNAKMAKTVEWKSDQSCSKQTAYSSPRFIFRTGDPKPNVTLHWSSERGLEMKQTHTVVPNMSDVSTPKDYIRNSLMQTNKLKCIRGFSSIENIKAQPGLYTPPMFFNRNIGKTIRDYIDKGGLKNQKNVEEMNVDETITSIVEEAATKNKTNQNENVKCEEEFNEVRKQIDLSKVLKVVDVTEKPSSYPSWTSKTIYNRKMYENLDEANRKRDLASGIYFVPEGKGVSKDPTQKNKMKTDCETSNPEPVSKSIVPNFACSSETITYNPLDALDGDNERWQQIDEFFATVYDSKFLDKESRDLESKCSYGVQEENESSSRTIIRFKKNSMKPVIDTQVKVHYSKPIRNQFMDLSSNSLSLTDSGEEDYDERKEISTIKNDDNDIVLCYEYPKRKPIVCRNLEMESMCSEKIDDTVLAAYDASKHPHNQIQKRFEMPSMFNAKPDQRKETLWTKKRSEKNMFINPSHFLRRQEESEPVNNLDHAYTNHPWSASTVNKSSEAWENVDDFVNVVYDAWDTPNNQIKKKVRHKVPKVPRPKLELTDQDESLWSDDNLEDDVLCGLIDQSVRTVYVSPRKCDDIETRTIEQIISQGEVTKIV